MRLLFAHAAEDTVLKRFVHCKVMMYQHITDIFKDENERKVNNK